MKRKEDNIYSVFAAAAMAKPHIDALAHNGRRISYIALQDAVHRTAGGLISQGIRRGDNVLVTLPMSIPLYTVVLALFQIGAVPVFLDAWVRRKRMTECLKTVRCRALIGPSVFLPFAWLVKALRQIPLKTSPGALLRGRVVTKITEVSGEETALITFTTGSTGRPKAADRTHRFLHAQIAALRPLLEAGGQDRCTNLPIVVLLQLALNKTTLLPPRGFRAGKAETAIRLHSELEAHAVEQLVVSPSVMETLLSLPPLPKIRSIITGGGSVFPELAARIHAAYPDARSIAVFGSTEAEPISHIAIAELAGVPLEQLLTDGLPVGYPDEAAEVRILRWMKGPLAAHTVAELDALTVPIGEWGEIVVAGPHVLQHYINDPEAEAAAKLRAGGKTWHRTGDAGRIDESGMLYFLGRCSETIPIPDGTIFPEMASYVIRQLNGRQGVALLKWQDQVWLVAEGEATGKITLQKTVAKLGLPVAHYHFLPRIPRDPRHHTKVDYTAVRKLLEARKRS